MAPAPPAPSSITLAAAIEKYLQLKARKKSLHEDERIGRVLQEAFGASRPLASITASVISEYKGKRLAVENGGGAPLSPAAINRPLQILRHLLRLAHEEWEVLPAVPRIRLEKERQGRLRWLTPQEANKLLEACRAQSNKALVDLVELALFTGLRQAELLELTWTSVDRSRGVILLEVTKSDKRREVPLCGPADSLLARRAAAGTEGLVFGTTSWYAFRAYWEAAVEAGQQPGLHFHDLRHTFASWAMQNGATLPELQKLLGHATLAMTMRYAHLSPDHLRTAVSHLDNVLAIPARQDAQKTQDLLVGRQGLEPWTR